MRHDPSNIGRYQYMAYASKSEGKGIEIILDKRRVLANLFPEYIKSGTEVSTFKTDEVKNWSAEIKDCSEERVSEIYREVYRKTKNSIEEGDYYFSEGTTDNLDLFALLHSLEHAFSYMASLITGLDGHFSGKIILSDCAILIYEMRNAGDGGVEYLIQERLADWFTTVSERINSCRYGCENGCATCLFIRDPTCNPVLPSEISGVRAVPNSLLNRSLVSRFLSGESH